MLASMRWQGWKHSKEGHNAGPVIWREHRVIIWHLKGCCEACRQYLFQRRRPSGFQQPVGPVQGEQLPAAEC